MYVIHLGILFSPSNWSLLIHQLEFLNFFIVTRCLKTINSKKYGVDLVCFTSHPTTVIYSSKNGWDGMFLNCCIFKNVCVLSIFLYISLLIWSMNPESLRLLSLHDNKYLRYFKGHLDRFGISIMYIAPISNHILYCSCKFYFVI